MTNHGDIIQVGMFAYINDDSMSEYGVSKGDVVYVAGDMVVSVTSDDPYQLRRLFVAGRVSPEGHLNPGSGGFTVDGLRLTKVPEEEQKRLDDIKRDDFEGREGVESPN